MMGAARHRRTPLRRNGKSGVDRASKPLNVNCDCGAPGSMRDVVVISARHNRRCVALENAKAVSLAVTSDIRLPFILASSCANIFDRRADIALNNQYALRYA